jgi:CheY-like chemotaxis protein
MQSDASGIKRQVEILVIGKPEAYGRLVTEVIEAHQGRKYDLRVTFAEHIEELLRLVRDREFDVFIVIAGDISFSYETSKPSREALKKRALKLIRRLKSRYGTPVLALHGWSDLDFGEKIEGADCSIRYPRIYNKLRETVDEFIEGTFDAKAAQKRMPVPDTGRGTLLIVDDDLSTCLNCKAFLDSKGFETRAAHSASQAVAILNQTKIDVVMINVQMPDASGLKFIRAVKKRYDVDVILITACTEIGDYNETQCNDAGYPVYSPALPRDMYDRIEQIVRQRKLEKFRQKFGITKKMEEETATEYFISGEASSAGIIPEEERPELIERLASLRKKVARPACEYGSGGPSSRHKPEKYHPNRLFEVFERLRLMDGCTLDCYFHRFSGFGLPYVYSRRTDSAPVESFGDFKTRFPQRRDRLRHIEIEPSPYGYFQFALLNHTAEQFHLFRNSPFGFTWPVVSCKQLERILDSITGIVSGKELQKAREINPRQYVWVSEGVVKVGFVAFSPLRGLYSHHTYIQSNMIVHMSRIKIVDCESSMAF